DQSRVAHELLQGNAGTAGVSHARAGSCLARASRGRTVAVRAPGTSLRAGFRIVADNRNHLRRPDGRCAWAQSPGSVRPSATISTADGRCAWAQSSGFARAGPPQPTRWAAPVAGL